MRSADIWRNSVGFTEHITPELAALWKDRKAQRGGAEIHRDRGPAQAAVAGRYCRTRTEWAATRQACLPGTVYRAPTERHASGGTQLQRANLWGRDIRGRRGRVLAGASWGRSTSGRA